MSFARKSVFGVLPATERGVAVHLGGDPKGKNVLYSNGRVIVIRDLANPIVSDQYTEHVANATVARYAPSGFYIASGDAHGNVRIWDTTQAEHPLKAEYKVLGGEIKDLAWDSESKRIIVVGNGNERFGHVFFADGGSSCGEIGGHSKVINSCDFKSSRPYRAVTGGDDNLVNYFEGPPFKYKNSLKDHTRFVNCVRFSPSGDNFVSVGADCKVFIYDGKTGEKTGEFTGNPHTGTIYSCSWSPDGKHLLTASADRTVRVWDVAAQTAVTTFEFGKRVEDQQVGCLWQGDHLVSLSLSGDFNYLDRNSPSKPTRVITGHTRPVTSLAIVDKTIFSGDSTGRLCYWEDTHAELVKGNVHSNQASQLSSAGSNLVSCGMDDTVRVTNVASKTVEGAYSCDSQPRSVAAGKNGYHVVATLKSLSVLQGASQTSNTSISYSAYSVAINPDGNEVAVGSDDSIHVYTLNGGNLSFSKKLEGASRGQVSSLSYSPDGKTLAAGDSKNQIVLWDTASGKPKLQDWVFHTAKVTCLAWSPSSSHLASGSTDTNIFVWSVEKTNKRIKIPGAHIVQVNGVAFTDENTLVSAGQDGCVKTWSITHH